MADRYLLETGAPDGYQLEDGSGVLILEDAVTAVIETGWLTSYAARPAKAAALSLAVLAASGLVWVPMPPAQAAAVGAWAQPLSKAAPRKAVPLGGPSYTFLSFPQPNYGGFQQPLSKAAVRRDAPQPELRPFGVTVAAAVAAPEGWQQPPSRAAPRPPVQQGNAFVPFDTAQVVIAANYGWWPPLSQARDRPPVWPGQSFVPFNTAQFVAAAWWQPLSQAAAKPPVWPGGPSYTFLSTAFTQNTVDISKWQQPLGKAAPKPPVWAGNAFVPFDTAQIIQNTIDYSLYQQPLSKAAPIPRAAIGNTFVPFDTAQVAVAANYGWWPPLEKATPRRTPTTQQRVAIAYPLAEALWGWWQQPSAAPPRTPFPQPELRPFGVQQVVAATPPNGWWADLSKSAPRPPVWQGAAFVPFDTAQVVAANYGWWQPASTAAPRRPVHQGGAVWVGRPLAGNNVDLGGWQQPLSRARDRSPVWTGGPSYTFLSTQFTQNTVYWGNYQQPLSRPADRPPVWQGASFVPFDTFQIIFNTIDYSLYMQPLSRAVPIPRAAIGNTFIPWDTVQVTPPPTVGGVQPPGYWYELWERIAERQGKRKRPAPELLIAVDELPPDWQPSKVFKVSPAVIEALAQAQSIDDIRELARQETGQVRNMLNMVIAEYKRRVRDEDDIEVLIMTLQ